MIEHNNITFLRLQIVFFILFIIIIEMIKSLKTNKLTRFQREMLNNPDCWSLKHGVIAMCTLLNRNEQKYYQNINYSLH